MLPDEMCPAFDSPEYNDQFYILQEALIRIICKEQAQPTSFVVYNKDDAPVMYHAFLDKFGIFLYEYIPPEDQR